MNRAFAAKISGIVLAFLACGFWSFVSLRNPREDFIYLYSGADMYSHGKNPYDAWAFQKEISSVLGRKNPYPSRFFAFALPPWDFIALRFLPFFSYRKAFYFWSLIVFFSSLAIVFSGLELAACPLGSGMSWLAILAFSFFPGLVHGVFYHRLAVFVFAVFMLGLFLWNQGQENLSAFLWGFLALLPQWFLPVFLFLLIRRKWRVCAMSLWLAVLGGFLSIFKFHNSLLVWKDFILSLSHYGSRFVFFDDQGLVLEIYKILHLFSFLRIAAFASLFEPSSLLDFFRKMGGAVSGIIIMGISYRAGEVQKRLSQILSLALLGSLYSHCGDQIWILPLFLWSLKELASKKAVFWLLLALVSLDIILIPNYRHLSPLFWFWAGYWGVGYLAALGVFWILNSKNRSSGEELKV